jgi:hypothetical protein
VSTGAVTAEGEAAGLGGGVMTVGIITGSAIVAHGGAVPTRVVRRRSEIGGVGDAVTGGGFTTGAPAGGS